MRNFTKKMKNRACIRYLYTGFMVTLSALLITAGLKMFVRPSGFLSSGFTGLSILIQMIAEEYGIQLNLGMINILLNIPAALLCVKSISLKFTFFSSLQVVLLSIFLNVVPFSPVFSDPMLNAIVGGVIYGLGTVVALKGNARSRVEKTLGIKRPTEPEI